MDAVEQLESLIGELETALQKREGAGDAIDRTLASAPRQTAVRSLCDDEAVVRFRQELVDGLIRMDTAGRLLGAVRQIISVVLAGRA